MTDVRAPEWRLQDRLARALDEADISVNTIADELGVSRQTISNYLHGRTVPNRATLRYWALRTGVPLEWITGAVTDGYGRPPFLTLALSA